MYNERAYTLSSLIEDMCLLFGRTIFGNFPYSLGDNSTKSAMNNVNLLQAVADLPAEVSGIRTHFHKYDFNKGC